MKKIEKILKEERIKTAKRSFEKAYLTYTVNREKALKEIKVEELKKELREIKEYSISNLERLKKDAIKNLTKSGIKVYEARKATDAIRIFKRIVRKGEKVVKSKSNVIHEIDLIEKIKNRNEVIETDCGDFLVQICNEKPSHPVTPALHIPIEKMVSVIEKRFKAKLKPNAKEIAKWVREYLREKIREADVGLTGANVISSDGSIFILENEGNISLVSRIPRKHVIITSIDKIVPTIKDAILICKASSIWGTGSSMPAYVNVISSPSKTADIQKEIVYGMHGAKEVHLILLDNNRSEIAKSDLKEILYCINCGACLYVCPVYRQIFDYYGFNYFGGRGVAIASLIYGLKKGYESGLYYCTTCMACKENCPLSIDIPNLIRKVRALALKNDITTESVRQMLENIEVSGNPFSEEKEGKIPDKLYCC
jgi:iron-sulfur cluster protein